MATGNRWRVRLTVGHGMLINLAGLAAASLLLCTFALALSSAEDVRAATAQDLTAYRALQPATQTATPRIRLRTPTPSGTAPTATVPVAGGPGTMVPTVAGAGTTAAAPGSTAVPGSVATSPTGGSVGQATNPPPAGPGSPAPLEIAPPALPGGKDQGQGTGGTAAGGTSDGSATGGGTGARSMAPGPRGIIAVPVDDKGVEAMWARFGSPRQGESPAERLTAHRPGPWGWWPLYVILAALYGYSVVRFMWTLKGAEERAEAVDDGRQDAEQRHPE